MDRKEQLLATLADPTMTLFIRSNAKAGLAEIEAYEETQRPGKLVLVCGIPGSGKSTWVKKTWTAQIGPSGRAPKARLVEADDYFMVPNQNGVLEYKFDPSKIALAHAHCQGRVEGLMMASFPTIYVANTFTQAWERQPYLELAAQYDYEVEIHVMANATNVELGMRNVHGVPREALERMADRFDLTPGTTIRIPSPSEVLEAEFAANPEAWV